MPKKKIAFVIYSLGSGGAERVVTTLANGLTDFYNVYIFTVVEREAFYPVSDQVTVLSCFHELPPSKGIIQALRNNYATFRKLHGLIRQNHIDILVAFMTTVNILSVLAARKAGIPVLISERNHPVKQRIGRIWSLLRKLIYPKADLLVVQTAEIANCFLPYLAAERVRIIPNPIAPELTQWRDSHPIKDKEKIILNVGRLTAAKDQALLIRAFSRLADKEWELLIIGEGPLRNKLESLIKELDVEDRVRLPGRSQNMAETYCSARIFAFSSLYEGMPNALIEAMHFGLPCISTDCPSGPSDLIEHGSSGYLVPVGDLDSFTVFLERLANGHPETKPFGVNAMARVQKLESDPILNKWKDLIESLETGGV